MFGFVALIAFVMLLVSIRSVFLAFKGVLMTRAVGGGRLRQPGGGLPVGLAGGLGLPPISSIDSTIPPLVLAMTFGLSMDYEIFLLTRIRERFLQTGNTRDAVAYGVSTSARTITSAALIMIAVFIGFAFAGMPLVAEIGVACAVAIAVDATVVRLVLVPALMAMFAQWNWWLPGWLARILPSVDFEKPLPKVDIGDLVVIPDDISTLAAPGIGHPHGGQVGGEAQAPGSAHHLRRRSAGLQRLPAVQAAANQRQHGASRASVPTAGVRSTNGGGNGKTVKLQRVVRAEPMHPVTLWRGRLSVALDALETEAESDRAARANATARWRPPTSSCPPATGCRSRPAPRRCGSRAI